MARLMESFEASLNLAALGLVRAVEKGRAVKKQERNLQKEAIRYARARGYRRERVTGWTSF